MPIIEYGEKEISYLSERDKVLGNFIKECGFIERETKPTYRFSGTFHYRAANIQQKLPLLLPQGLRLSFPK